MTQVETLRQAPLERILPQLINEKGLSGAAKEIGVSKHTISLWMQLLGVNIRTFALASGDSVEIKRLGKDDVSLDIDQESGAPAQTTGQTQYAHAVTHHIGELMRLVAEQPHTDRKSASEVTARLLVIRDDLLALEKPDASLDFETQSMIKRIIHEIRERTPWAAERLRVMLREPVVAGVIGAALQHYLFE